MDVGAFIRANLRLKAVPGVPGIEVYAAHPGSGLSRLGQTDGDDPAPYWAYGWAGGTVLARHILFNPDVVAGLRVLDLGTGSGLVAIAAAKAGAADIRAIDIDPNAVVAAGLNAAANAVTIALATGDITGDAPPDVDLILVGDLFYDPELAAKVTAFLGRCRDSGVAVLVGDPKRAWLPHSRLRVVAEYDVPDFGDVRGVNAAPSAVFAFD